MLFEKFLLLFICFVSLIDCKWLNWRLDDEWECKLVYHPRGAQVLITVEIMESQQQHAKSAELQIRFPNSAAIAAESRNHGEYDNSLAHDEILFKATREGSYSYCMRDVLREEFSHLKPEVVARLAMRRGRIKVESRFKDEKVSLETFSHLADLPDDPYRHEL